MTPRCALALALAALLAIAGLSYLSAFSAGTIRIQVRGSPLEWRALNVVFSDVQVHRAEEGDPGGWFSLPLSNTDIDFVTLGDAAQLLSVNRAPAGKYTQLRVVVNSVNGVLADGTPVGMIVPDGELKTITPFDLPGGDSVTVTLEFDLASSIHAAGDQWIFRPVLGSVQVS